MSEEQLTPAGLRACAEQIRHSAQYAQGNTRRAELEEAQALERQADQLERSLSEASQ